MKERNVSLIRSEVKTDSLTLVIKDKIIAIRVSFQLPQADMGVINRIEEPHSVPS